MFRDQVLTSVGYFTGRHDIRFGYQFIDGGEKSSNWSTSGMRAVYRTGRPDSVNTYNVPITSTSYRIPVAFEPWHRDHGVFIQDKWTPTSKLTLNLGLRFETTYGWLPATCRPATTFVVEQCFPEIQGAPDFKAIVPRVSAVYDVFGDGRTALKFSASRYDQPITLSNVQRVNPLDHRERHPPVDRLPAGSDLRLRPQRRSDAAAERAGCLDRVPVRDQQPIRRTISSGRRRTSTTSKSSARFPATSSSRLATRAGKRGATSATGTWRCRSRATFRCR